MIHAGGCDVKVNQTSQILRQKLLTERRPRCEVKRVSRKTWKKDGFAEYYRVVTVVLTIR